MGDVTAPLALGAADPMRFSPGLFLSGDDALRVSSFNGAASVVLSIEGRALTPEGQIVMFAHRHVPNTDRSIAQTVFPLGLGYLLDVSVRASSASPRRGQCWIVLELVRGATGAVVPLRPLASDYVTDTGRAGFPHSGLVSSIDGRGVIRSITGTDPAANTEISETVPTNARWRVLGVVYTLVTDANVANRESSLVFDDGAAVVFRYPSGQAQTAGATVGYSWANVGVVRIATAAQFHAMCLADVYLPGGFRIRTITTNIQVGDNYGAPQLFVEEWIED